MASMAPCWSQLDTDVLDMIMQRLPLPDCFNFAQVCKLWRSVFLVRRRLLPPPPVLMLNLHPLTQGTTQESFLWGLHGGRFLKHLSPRSELSLPFDLILGSSNGWLAVGSMSMPGVHLWSPTLKQRIPLPSTLSDGMKVGTYRINTSWFTVIRVHLTAGNHIVVANGCCGADFRVAWCRPGDMEWSTFTNFTWHATVDSAFLNNELYVLRHKAVGVYSLHSSPKISIIPFPKKLHWGFKRLVVSDGEIFCILWRNHNKLSIYRRIEGGWMTVESLGDRLFLVGDNGAESFHPQDVMGSGFEPNCIYYQSLGDLVKYSVAERSTQRIALPIPTDATTLEERVKWRIDWIKPQAW